MTVKTKTIALSSLALTLALVAVVISVNSALAFRGTQNFIKPKDFNAVQVNQQVKAARQARKTVRSIQPNSVKRRVSNQLEATGLRNRVASREAEVARRACERAHLRYQKRLKIFQQIGDKLTVHYQVAISKIQGALNKLEALGIDVTTAREKLDIWKEKVDAAIASFTASKAEITTLVNLDCSTEPSVRKAQIAKVRSSLKVAREKAQEARNYYHQELRPELLSLRNQALDKK